MRSPARTVIKTAACTVRSALWTPTMKETTNSSFRWTHPFPAFAGVFDATAARDNVRDGSYAQRLVDLFTETNDDRQINEVTSILGQVANMTWVSPRSSLHRMRQTSCRSTGPLTSPSRAAVFRARCTWSGDEAFNGDPISQTAFILRNIWSMTDNYTIETTSVATSDDTFRELQRHGRSHVC